MVKALPPSVYSPDHLRYCVEELEGYVNALEARQRGSAATEVPELSPESAALIKANLEGTASGDPKAVLALAEELGKLTSKATTINITLSAFARHSLKEELVTWMRTNIAPSVLVDFHVNPDMAGGIVVRSASSVFDDSFRGRLLAQPERFTRILNDV